MEEDIFDLVGDCHNQQSGVSQAEDVKLESMIEKIKHVAD